MREDKKPHRYNQDHQREVRRGGDRTGRGARDGSSTGRRGRGRLCTFTIAQELVPRGQQPITMF